MFLAHLSVCQCRSEGSGSRLFDVRFNGEIDCALEHRSVDRVIYAVPINKLFAFGDTF